MTRTHPLPELSRLLLAARSPTSSLHRRTLPGDVRHSAMRHAGVSVKLHVVDRVPSERPACPLRAAEGGKPPRIASDAVRDQIDQGRLSAAGPVWLLSGADRRECEGLVCDAGRSGCGTRGRDARRDRRGGEARSRALFRRRGRGAVRFLHSGNRTARTQPARRRIRLRVGRRSRGRSTAISAAAPVTRRSSTRSSFLRGSAAALRSPSRSREASPHERRAIAGRSSSSASSRSSTISTCPACCTARSFFRGTRAHASSRSTPGARMRWRVCLRSPPQPTFPAIAGSDCSTPTGPDSSRSAKRRATSAT